MVGDWVNTVRTFFAALHPVEMAIVVVATLAFLAAILNAIEDHVKTIRAKRPPPAPSTPRPLIPPVNGPGHQWWEEWMLSVRGCAEEEKGLDGTPTLVSSHLFFGTASAINFKWGRKATATDYWPNGGIRSWSQQKFRDWHIEGPQPLYIHQDLLKEHCYLVGPSGGGKSSLGIMAILTQLIHGHALPDGKRSPLQPIVILDLKGDNALFHTVKAEVEQEKLQKFKFFNLEKDAATYRFNPFRGFNPDARSLPQLCQMILDALALNHGKGYGRSYYTEQSRSALSEVLRRNPQIASFHDLQKGLETFLAKEKADKQARYDAFELLSVIKTLGEYRQLITSVDDEVNNRESIIYMPDVLKERQVVYFWLPAALESISAGEVAKLILFNLRAAAQDHKRMYPDDPVQTVLVIDELQRAAGENLAGILQDARSFGIGAILSNQSLEDLKSPTGFDLAPTILTNTCVKVFFNSPQRGSYYVFVERGMGLTAARQYPQKTNPWLRELAPEELGYVVNSAWPTSKDTYRQRDRSPLPDWSAVPGGNPWAKTPTSPPSKKKKTEDPDRKKRIGLIKTLFEDD